MRLLLSIPSLAPPPRPPRPPGTVLIASAAKRQRRTKRADSAAYDSERNDSPFRSLRAFIVGRNEFKGFDYLHKRSLAMLYLFTLSFSMHFPPPLLLFSEGNPAAGLLPWDAAIA